MYQNGVTVLKNLSKLRIATCKRFQSACPVPRTKHVEPIVKKRILDNGITIATEENESLSLACLNLFVETGPRYEDASNNGINHFIEHMAFKGFKYQNRAQVEHFALMTGSRFSAHTSQEIQRFTVLCLPNCIQEATCMLCGIVNQLEMNCHEVECERHNICRELDDADRDYKTIVFENLIQTAFQGTSLGLKVVGPSKNYQEFSGCSAQMYMCQQYQPWRLFFIAAAPTTNSCITANVEQQLACMPASTKCLAYGATRYTGSSVIYRDDSRAHVHVACAFEAPGFLSDEYMSMLVLKNIVGSWCKTHAIFGAWPDLARRCADTALCESFESFYLTYRDIGLWGVYFVAGKHESEDFLHNWQDVLLGMACHMTDTDVMRAKVVTKTELMKNRMGCLSSALDLGREVIYRGARPPLYSYLEAVDALSTAELQKLAYSTLYTRLPVLAAAGPTENIPDYVRLWSGQFWLRW